MLVSVVITTKNEEKHIENCLRSILNQTHKDIEIIVVDNNSTDKTKEIAKGFTEKVFNISEEVNLDGIKNFRGAQLNFGVQKAVGEVIFFPDADMTFDNDLIADAVEKLKNFDALFVPEKICGKGFFGKVRDFERSFYNGTVIDGVRFVKKEVFNKVGGFDVKNIVFGFDDWDFTKTLKKNNFKLDTADKSLYHHEEYLTLRVYIGKKEKYINSVDSYISKWGKNDLDVKKQFGLWYRYFGVFWENGKWKRFVRHLVFVFSLYFVRGLVGFAFVRKSRQNLNNER